MEPQTDQVEMLPMAQTQALQMEGSLELVAQELELWELVWPELVLCWDSDPDLPTQVTSTKRLLVLVFYFALPSCFSHLISLPGC